MLARDIENLERKPAGAAAPLFTILLPRSEEDPELLSETGRQAEEEGN